MATSEKKIPKKKQNVTITPRTDKEYIKWSQDLGDAICEELAAGKSLKKTCEKQGMPSMRNVFRWLREYPEFLKQYEAAKQESADAMAEDILDISDENPTDAVSLGHKRLRVDTRKFLMAKMKPKKYGDKLDLTSDGKVLPTPIYNGASSGETKDKQ